MNNHLEWSEDNKEIFPAYIAAWGKVTSPAQEQTVEFEDTKGNKTKYSYTDLKGIYDAIKTLFAEHGIAVMHDIHTEVDEHTGKEKNCVNTMLLHNSGQWIKSGYLKYEVITKAVKEYKSNTVIFVPDMQANGSEITYMRRYSLSATVGLATEKDDDANRTKQETEEPPKTESKNQNTSNNRNNQNSGNNQNRTNQNQNRNNQPPAGKPVETVTGPPKMEEWQRKKIWGKLRDIGSQHNMDAKEVYVTLQTAVGSKTEVKDLSQAGAQYVLLVLEKCEETGLLPDAITLPEKPKKQADKQPAGATA